MTIENLLNQYCFHDSSLEQISVDATTHTVSIDLMFCNWQQSDFSSEMEEIIPIRLQFQRVKSIERENLKTDESSENEILEAELLDDEFLGIGIHFLLYNWELTDDSHLRIYAEDVKFIKL